jgi:hypothetical protein
MCVCVCVCVCFLYNLIDIFIGFCWWFLKIDFVLYFCWMWNQICRNPSLARLWTKREGRITSRAPGSAKECEGMNLHTPKWTPIARVGVSNGLPNFQSMIIGVKTHQLETFLEKLLKRRCLKWALMTHLDTWNTSYGQRKVETQIGNLIPDH